VTWKMPGHLKTLGGTSYNLSSDIEISDIRVNSYQVGYVSARNGNWF
jgi:hypothetical protein